MGHNKLGTTVVVLYFMQSPYPLAPRWTPDVVVSLLTFILTADLS